MHRHPRYNESLAATFNISPYCWLVLTDFNLIIVNLAAELAGVKIVSYEWILDSVEGKAKVDEGRYLMAVGGAKTALDQTIGKGKKRAAKSSDDEDIHVQQPPAKKRKDGQKAHSDTVQVWVDDVCPLASRCTPLRNPSFMALIPR